MCSKAKSISWDSSFKGRGLYYPSKSSWGNRCTLFYPYVNNWLHFNVNLLQPMKIASQLVYTYTSTFENHCTLNVRILSQESLHLNIHIFILMNISALSFVTICEHFKSLHPNEHIVQNLDTYCEICIKPTNIKKSGAWQLMTERTCFNIFSTYARHTVY